MFGILSCLRGVLHLLLWDLDICRVFQQTKAIEAEQLHCCITNTHLVVHEEIDPLLLPLTYYLHSSTFITLLQGLEKEKEERKGPPVSGRLNSQPTIFAMVKFYFQVSCFSLWFLLEEYEL